MLRILPAYWLALTVLALYPGLTGVFGNDWWRYYLLVEIYDGDVGAGGMLQTWSLCIEAAFYVALPCYILGLHPIARRGCFPLRARSS